ncbi:hypothetical protein HCH_06419 [Hahella chejuensis KCTC 2396]|uniref:Uncharacterized protein n=1 Tax=Hahella chejuensis (strain KCTC 2396) TaxID=349521 RepID=Q2S8G0_HAHCH|nr:hypothetical protein HCH_06419 [Hahella chejuensis KCTC 2396]
MQAKFILSKIENRFDTLLYQENRRSHARMAH